MAKATAVRVSTGKKFSQLLIITPAVAIDSSNETGYTGPFNSHDSGCGSSGSDASLNSDEHNERINVSGDSDSNNNKKINQRKKMSSKGRQQFVTNTAPSPSAGSGGGGDPAHSWRWCSIICSAVRCFRAAAHFQQHLGTIHYSSSRGVSTIGSEDITRRSTIKNALTGVGGTRSGGSRFSGNHVYEYTIKSYRSEASENDHINNNSGGNHSGGDSNDRSNIMYKL